MPSPTCEEDAMVRKLELEIPDADYARLVQDAARIGQTPESAILKIVADRYGISSNEIIYKAIKPG